MFQVTFSEQCLVELDKLDTLEQMRVVAPLTELSEAQLLNPKEPLDVFSREGRDIFRLRTGDFRLYFERRKFELHTLCILHKNTLTDFIFRTKLPISEEQLIEQETSFWKYLESLTR